MTHSSYSYHSGHEANSSAEPLGNMEPEGLPGFEKSAMMPVRVSIVTADHEIQGVVYVSRNTREDRRLTELLSDPDRRFLAITDAELISRHVPSSVRHYAFLQIHIDTIMMLHPATQVLVNAMGYSKEQSQRFSDFRHKVNAGNPTTGT
ncbi:MAG: hypothetical protein SFZ03_02820 [Candidatus Melainabacteria bacterium]|nr:hypothetical protein [Candidatus Melainabacteria bacterium]